MSRWERKELWLFTDCWWTCSESIKLLLVPPKTSLIFPFILCVPSTWTAPLLFLQPKEPHLTSEDAGSPVVMKVYGLARANPKWATSCWKKNQNTKTQPIKKPNKAKQINKKQRNKKKADFWAGMVSCISLAILYLTRAIKGGLVCDLISTTSGMIPLESLKIPLMPPEEKAAIASKPVSHQKGW